jgi:hypothetical protein
LLRACSHLANGSKHFKANPKRHKSVQDTKHYEGQFDPEQFDLDQFDTDQLEVHLKGKAAKQFGPVISAPSLARKVLEFWEAILVYRDGLNRNRVSAVFERGMHNCPQQHRRHCPPYPEARA